MPAGSSKLSRRDPAVAAIVRHWRVLTTPARNRHAGPGERTLVACSGGADSCALVLALAAAAADRIVVGHVVHDLRPESESLADRDAARDLAESLGLEFAQAHVRVRQQRGNLEALARHARYVALGAMASQRGVRFVATAHHADDQIETILMSLLRGTGGAGIRGIAARRRLDLTRWVIRPMLTDAAEINRASCRRLCTEAGVRWREDATNADASRLRARVRSTILPALRDIRPDVGLRSIAAARQAEAVSAILRTQAAIAFNLHEFAEPHASMSWSRDSLRVFPAVVVGELLLQVRSIVCAERGADRLSRRSVEPVVRAIRDRATEPRTFELAGMVVRVTAGRVTIRPGAASKHEHAELPRHPDHSKTPPQASIVRHGTAR